MSDKNISLPLTATAIDDLTAGDQVALTGPVIIMRDAAQERIRIRLEKNEPVGIELAGSVVFYAGPAPNRPDGSINSIGPTTAKRMDKYLLLLARLGVAATIGKGERTEAGANVIRDTGMLYFVAIGGIAALLSHHVKELKVIAFDDLGPEAVYEAVLDGFPVVVAQDAHGGDLIKDVWAQWRLNS